MGAVELIHNHHTVLHVEVHGGNPEVCLYRFPDLVPVNWARKNPGRIWEGETLCLGLLRVYVCGIPLRPPSNPVLHIAVSCH